MIVVHRDQDVARLDVAVNDALLMGVLHGAADLGQQLQTLARAEIALVAELGDWHAADEFHDEVRPTRGKGDRSNLPGRPGGCCAQIGPVPFSAPGFGAARIEHFGDIGMIHQRQHLPLGLEAGDDLTAVHARLDDLQGDFALDRRCLLGHEDGSHAAHAQLLQQLVGTDHGVRRNIDRLLVELILRSRLGRLKPLDRPVQRIRRRQVVAQPVAPRPCGATACLRHRPAGDTPGEPGDPSGAARAMKIGLIELLGMASTFMAIRKMG